MSNTARKARKRAGIPFTPSESRLRRAATPLEDRSFVTDPVYRRRGDANPIGIKTLRPGFGPRSPLRIARFLENGGRP